jgi:hypothetical protein
MYGSPPLVQPAATIGIDGCPAGKPLARQRRRQKNPAASVVTFPQFYRITDRQSAAR